MAKHRRWTQEEVGFLEVFYREPDENYDSIADFLGRTKKKLNLNAASGTNENSGGKV